MELEVVVAGDEGFLGAGQGWSVDQGEYDVDGGLGHFVKKESGLVESRGSASRGHGSFGVLHWQFLRRNHTVNQIEGPLVNGEGFVG